VHYTVTGSWVELLDRAMSSRLVLTDDKVFLDQIHSKSGRGRSLKHFHMRKMAWWLLVNLNSGTVLDTTWQGWKRFPTRSLWADKTGRNSSVLICLRSQPAVFRSVDEGVEFLLSFAPSYFARDISGCRLSHNP